jgi:formate dehydrogenase major subunit/formate dehydrogenase alpha subunit
VDPAEGPDDEFPLILTTGRVLYHWHAGEMTHRAAGLEAMYPQALVEINPKDAHKAGIEDGDLIKVFSRRGEILSTAQVTNRVEPGIIFTTFHFAEAAANFLTNPALDPIAKIPEFKVAAVRVEKA